MASHGQARPRAPRRVGAGRGRGAAVGGVAAGAALGAVAFAATNVDDLFLLVAWFGAGRYRGRDILVGQLLGIGALFAASLAAALLAWVIPGYLLVWIGVLPIMFGLSMLLNRDAVERPAPPASGILAVASATIASGGDNLGTYIPLFATSSGEELAAMGVVFALLTLLWCLAARALVRHPGLGAPLRRHGPLVAPWVLIGIGLWILLR